MKKYIGILSIIYIIIIIVRLKDTKKSFKQHKQEYKELKEKLEAAAHQSNPFLMMKFTNFVFYFFLILYYIANLVLFKEYMVISIFSCLLILVGLFKLKQKLGVTSINDMEEVLVVNREKYHRKNKFNFWLGLVEFAYAFNALAMISFYY
jgi:hypothetical protein